MVETESKVATSGFNAGQTRQVAKIKVAAP
jgi:hypothetical protein